MRLKVPNETGYVVRSTKERDELLAEDVARKEFASLTYKIENNLEIEFYDFEKLYKTWWKSERSSKSVARRQYVEGTINRYFMPYFTKVLTKRSITSLTNLDIEDYWSWRIGYWESPEGQEVLEKASKRRNNRGEQRHSKKGMS